MIFILKEAAGIECLFSYRTIDRISKLEEVFSNLYEVLSISLLKGLDEDDINIISNNLFKIYGMNKNKYALAIKKFNDELTKENKEEEKEEKPSTAGLIQSWRLPSDVNIGSSLSNSITF